jgi:8-oxo-dGTP pyrophosphatase MutT (NUDIX family)
MNAIDKVGLLVIRGGKVLLCRKRTGTQLLILPGGKRERGESDETCLRRELAEEIGNVSYSPFVYVGTYRSGDVKITLYQAELSGDPSPQAEIAQLVWFAGEDDWSLLPQSLREQIFPDIRARGIWA